MNSNKIALFDSGVGQLSVFLEVKKLLPQENFVIFADQKNMPYGEKSPAQIKKFVTQAVKFLISKHNVKMVILACNTATVLALNHLRKNFTIPIIGVVPAIKPAVEKSKKNRIVNMSTSATAKSPYLKNLINTYAKDSQVLKLGCPGLENAIESLNKKEIARLVKKYAIKVNGFDPDIVVLGCTHYPLIKGQIEKNLNPGIMIIDSGAAIAKQANKVLKETGQMSSVKENDIFYTTSDPVQFSKVSSTLVESNISAIKVSL
jgi:glutamate racemase